MAAFRLEVINGDGEVLVNKPYNNANEICEVMKRGESHYDEKNERASLRFLMDSGALVTSIEVYERDIVIE